MLRPESRGYIALKSLDPHIQPIIQPNYFSTQKDRDTLIKGVKMSREIMNQPAFDDFRGKEINPGDHIQTDQEIEEFIRNQRKLHAPQLQRYNEVFKTLEKRKTKTAILLTSITQLVTM